MRYRLCDFFIHYECGLLQTPVLHYSLSSHHVLLDSNRVCKLTGFATAEVVRDREAWEKGNGVSGTRVTRYTSAVFGQNYP